MAYLGQGMNKDALHWFNEAKKIAPTDPEIISKESVFIEAYESGRYIENLVGVIKYTKDQDSVDTYSHELFHLPHQYIVF